MSTGTGKGTGTGHVPPRPGDSKGGARTRKRDDARDAARHASRATRNDGNGDGDGARTGDEIRGVTAGVTRDATNGGTGPGRRRGFAAWAILLLGTIAAAAMLPQFAIFVPVVAAAWILARLGLLPGFIGHRHPGVRLSGGPDAPLTTVAAILESESKSGPTAPELLSRLLKRADALAGPRAKGHDDCIAWASGPARAPEALSGLRIDDWPQVREALERGDGLVLATRSRGDGRRRQRIDAMIAGDRRLIEPILLGHAADLREARIEVVTTGWLRHAERVRARRAARA